MYKIHSIAYAFSVSVTQSKKTFLAVGRKTVIEFHVHEYSHFVEMYSFTANVDKSLPLFPQFKSVLNTVELFDRHVANLKFLKYRPEVGVREGPRAWWRYAISAVKEEQVRRKLEMWSWKHILEHR